MIASDMGHKHPGQAESGLPPRRSAVLDGLRGYAAATVVIYHAILGANDDLVGSVLFRSVLAQSEPGRILAKVALSLFSGEAAVAIFFVISGIVLLRSLRAMLARSSDPTWTTWAFLLRRVIRLWPILAVVLTAQVAVFALVDRLWPGHLTAFTSNDLLTNIMLRDYPVNRATWTLRWEFIGAPVILLWFFAERRFGAGAVAPALTATIAIAWWLPSLRHNIALVSTLPFLAAGMAIESGLLASLTRSLRAPATLAAALAIFATELFLPLANGGAFLHLLALLLTVTTFVAILEAESPGPATALLLARPSQFLGRISFSLYLCNVPVCSLLFALAFALVGPDFLPLHPIESGLVIGSAAIILTWPIAAASERWIEQTSIRVGRALTRSPRRTEFLALEQDQRRS